MAVLQWTLDMLIVRTLGCGPAHGNQIEKHIQRMTNDFFKSRRGAARERELAVRSALGASRARLIKQTLTEAALLFVAGATAGIALPKGFCAYL